MGFEATTSKSQGMGFNKSRHSKVCSSTVWSYSSTEQQEQKPAEIKREKQVDYEEYMRMKLNRRLYK